MKRIFVSVLLGGLLLSIPAAAQESAPDEIIIVLPPVVIQQSSLQRQPPILPSPVFPLSRVIEVIPRLPDPGGCQMYHLQVGAFPLPEIAAKVIHTLKNAGFNTAYEVYDQWYRVLVVGVPAAQVYDAIQTLGTLGIKQIWVRE